MLDFIFLIISLFLLYLGAELALNASEKIGVKLKFSPLMIGMLLVGLGTSLPEFFVSHIAAYKGEPDIALGNVIGSNITNIFLVLGIVLFIVPIKLKGKDLKNQFYFHLALTLAFFLLSLRGKFDILTVLVLFGFFISYLLSSKNSMASEVEITEEEIEESLIKVIPKAIIGFGLLYYGGELLVESGKKVCVDLGLSEYVISVILFAFGTSFPELVTSLIAALRKKNTKLIIGNVIGSNIFNISFVLGTMFPYRFEVNRPLIAEGLTLLVASVIFVIYNRFKLSLGKKEGLFFLAGYGSIVYYWLK